MELFEDVIYLESYFSKTEQKMLVEAIRNVVRQAPLFTPTMPRTGKPLSVKMSNCGSLGWVSDVEGGYRYQALHPVTNQPWPEMPEILQRLWQDLSNYPKAAEACLINHYDSTAKMGMHQDKDELDFSAPVISVSLGDSCLFRVGGLERGGKTQSIKLHSGDVVVLQGEGRLRFHGVDKIYPNTSSLFEKEGRINLTLRRVNPAN